MCVTKVHVYMCMLQGCTYNHLHRDTDGAVEGWVSSIFGHYCQVDHPSGNLLVVQRPGHTDHWWTEGASEKMILSKHPQQPCPHCDSVIS